MSDLQTPSAPVSPLPRIRAAVDVFENDVHYLVRADVPGATKKDVEINFHDGELSVEARPKDASGEPTALWVRKLAFPDDVDPDAIDASLEAGVLSLTLAKAAAHLPRKITITS